MTLMQQRAQFLIEELCWPGNPKKEKQTVLSAGRQRWQLAYFHLGRWYCSEITVLVGNVFEIEDQCSKNNAWGMS